MDPKDLKRFQKCKSLSGKMYYCERFGASDETFLKMLTKYITDTNISEKKRIAMFNRYGFKNVELNRLLYKHVKGNFFKFYISTFMLEEEFNFRNLWQTEARQFFVDMLKYLKANPNQNPRYITPELVCYIGKEILAEWPNAYPHTKVKILSILYSLDPDIRRQLDDAFHVNAYIRLTQNDSIHCTSRQIELILINNNARPVTTKRSKTYYEDGQNVHNSYINENMKHNLSIVMKLKPYTGTNYPKFGFENIEGTVNGASLHDVFLRVYQYIVESKHKGELLKRLNEEIADGRDKCWTGKMSRLINTLSGFYEEIVTDVVFTNDLINRRLQKILPEDKICEIGSGNLKDFIEKHESQLLKGSPNYAKAKMYLETLY